MYKDIKEIYDHTDLAVFSMATTQLMIMGWNKAEKLTDEEIAEQEGNGLMTQEFVQDLLRLARKVAKTCSPVDSYDRCNGTHKYQQKGFTVPVGIQFHLWKDICKRT